jgi:NSS family neurotransmitter:Na+ symporter
MSNESNARVSFGGRFSIIAVAAGSAIGLGNIWKFPYITGVNGGAAFIIVYLVCIALIGLPVLMSEFLVGRRGQKNIIGSYSKLAGKKSPWILGGFISIMASAMILSFYGVVAGWTLEYVVKAVSNVFEGKSPEEIGQVFGAYVSNPTKTITCQLIFMAMTAGIIIAGVKKGIEGFSRVMMPVLLGIIILLGIRAVTLDGAGGGLSFLFKPDFSKLTAAGVLDALGHAFFTLSLGAGTMITYGSYINKNENIGATAVQVALADTVIALLAGVAIFPAVFAFGLEPGAGPGLVFVTLPNVFGQMPGGYIFCILFFVLLAVAALTSSISMLEVGVAYLSEDMGLSRTKATLLLASLISGAGILCALSMGPSKDALTLGGKNFFDWLDYITSNFALPFGGLAAVLFVGWGLGKKQTSEELASGSRGTYSSLFLFVAKYVAPVGIGVVFLHSFGVF